MAGILFDIQRFALNDGPGIRTTVFLKGCPLRCVWCHNPESQIIEKQLGFLEDKCVLCGKCIMVCPEQVHKIHENRHTVNFDACTACGLCVDGCPAGALRMYGYQQEIEEIIAIVRNDKPYYDESGGGVTLSGGEPLFQFDFAMEILRAVKQEGIQTCVDTTGFVSRERLLSIIPLTDIFLFDYKITDPVNHLKYTGVPIEPILDSLRTIEGQGGKVILRCPIIPDINFNDAHLSAISMLAKLYHAIVQVDLLPYHTTGNSKYHRIGNQLPFTSQNLESSRLILWQKRIQDLSGKVVTVG